MELTFVFIAVCNGYPVWEELESVEIG